MIRPGFEPATSCIASGYSYNLAIKVSCYRKLKKQYVPEIGDSMKIEEMNRIDLN